MATLTETFTNIANSIRLKTETTDKITPENMPSMIESITTGGNAEPAVVQELSITSNGTYRAPEGIDGYTPVIVNVPQDGSPPAEAFVIKGDCGYRFANGGWDWFLNQHGHQITTKDISNASQMFYMCEARYDVFPFNFNFYNTSGVVYCNDMFYRATGFKYLTDENVAGMLGKIGSGRTMFYMSNFEKIPSLTFNNGNNYDYGSFFDTCKKLKEIGDLVNIYPSSFSCFFKGCESLRYPPRFINPKWDYVNTGRYCSAQSLFENCYSLRSIPEGYFDNWIKKTKSSFYSSYHPMLNLFCNCFSLDEVKDLPFFIEDDVVSTSNIFQSTFSSCYRLKKLTFETNEDGTPRILNLSRQTIDLSTFRVGYLANEIAWVNYNHGLTTATKITDDATYQALKDNPDSWTTDINYSRYNKVSAIETIATLPDTSAYVATQSSGPNTIKFKGASGALTDGGAINTMTEEEIAVAVAKGWTVSFG